MMSINHQPSTINSFFHALSTYGTVLAQWRLDMGPDFALGQAFLRPTGEIAEEYPCIHADPCGCHHRVSDYGEPHAVCTCGDDDGDGCSPCPEFPLTEEEVHTYAPDLQKLTREIRRSLGIEGDQLTTDPETRDLWRIGTKSNIPVYFCLTDTSAVGAFQALKEFLIAHREPALLLVQTERVASFLPAAIRNRHAIVAIGQVLKVSENAKLELTQPLDPILRKLNDYQPSTINHQLPTQLSTLNHQLRAIEAKVGAVSADYQQLRESKTRLEKMSAEGLFAFTQKIDAHSFKVFCAILAEGDIAKASRRLSMPDSSVRDLVSNWCTRGGAYSVMSDLVRWRKKVGRKEKLPLNLDVFHQKQPSVDYAGLLSDVLDGLLSMTPGNWEDQSAELADLLRSHVMDTAP